MERLIEGQRITYTNSKNEIKKAQVQRAFYNSDNEFFTEDNKKGYSVEAWCSTTGNMLLIFDSNNIKLDN